MGWGSSRGPAFCKNPTSWAVMTGEEKRVILLPLSLPSFGQEVEVESVGRMDLPWGLEVGLEQVS